jgi:hypothetical protein
MAENAKSPADILGGALKSALLLFRIQWRKSTGPPKQEWWCR